MGKVNTAQYIITESEPNRIELADMRTRILHLGDEMFEGAFSVECVWYCQASETVLAEAHSHEFN